MRKKNIEVDSKKAFELHQQIMSAELDRRKLLVENIERLSEMFDSQGYKAILGSDPTPNWSGYLGQVEVFYSRAQVERWRKIYNYFKSIGIQLGTVLDIPDTRLEDLAKLNLSDGSQLKELIQQARILTALDWRDSIAEAKGQPTSYDCDHKNEIYQICKKCGLRHKVDVPKENGNTV